MTHVRRRLAAGAAAASLAIVGGVAVLPTAASAAPVASDVDYFADSFDGLREGSVFTAVTFERFEALLKNEGTYAFLIGGPADDTTQAAAEHIDAVAAAYGVDAVYTFDPRLDGADIDIRTTELADLSGLWPRLVNDYLNKDTTPQFAVPGTDGYDPDADPYLVIYDRAHTSGGVEDRVIASLATEVTDETLAADGGSAYREEIGEVFDAVSAGGAAEVDVQSQFGFFHDEVNERHASQYPDAASYGGEIFTDADGEDFRLQSVTYPELVHLLESDGEHTILFGGTWCHNTRAVIKDVNRAAAQADIETVYVFDLRLDGTSGNDLHIRDSNSEISHLYGDLVSEYFPNLRTQYVLNGNDVTYYPGGDKSQALQRVEKLQVPYLIQYDRSNAAEPIRKDWLRTNADGSFTEYMTEWWWVDGFPGKNSRALAPDVWAAQQATNWAFADEAIAKVYDFFGVASAPAVPAAPTAVADGSSVAVSWTAPADAGVGARLKGYTVSLGALSRQVPAGTTSTVFTDVPVGTHSATVSARNVAGISAASAPASVRVEAASTPAPGPTSSPTPLPSASLPATGAQPVVSITGDLRPGGQVVVRGTGLPADESGVRVELHSTPSVLGTVTTTAGGAFSLSTRIPSSVPAGAHAVVVYVDGVEVARAAVSISVASGLAATGSDGLPLLAAGTGLALLLAGGLAIAARRRTA